MNVSELIAQLQKFAPDTEVLCDDRITDALLGIEGIGQVDVVTDTDGYAADTRMFLNVPNPDTLRPAVVITIEGFSEVPAISITVEQ